MKDSKHTIARVLGVKVLSIPWTRFWGQFCWEFFLSKWRIQMSQDFLISMYQILRSILLGSNFEVNDRISGPGSKEKLFFHRTETRSARIIQSSSLDTYIFLTILFYLITDILLLHKWPFRNSWRRRIPYNILFSKWYFVQQRTFPPNDIFYFLKNDILFNRWYFIE